jgi:predicted site-specific integrase-resolvase
MPMSKSEYTERNCLSLQEFCCRNGIGRTTAYKEIKEGRLHPRKVGRRTLISIEEEARWFANASAFGEIRHG